ncbi:hypothetical protein R1flu_004666 [Riccia fluitans]|uniref:mitogen-activated protein kinase kinase kinase n=1 Tax=Riccia fluitans TaxID=41844 RepID=A0ABD1YUY6_9MARC
MESLKERFTPHVSRSGGGGRKLDSGGGMRKLERRNATKNINYEHNTRSRRPYKYDPESSFDDSDSNHSREDPNVFNDYRLVGKASVDDLNEVCRYLGLPAPDSLGIPREDWDANKFPNNSHVIGIDSSSLAQEETLDFTFPVSPPPSHLPSHLFKGRLGGGFIDAGVGEDAASTSPSARDEETAKAGIPSGQKRTEAQGRVQEMKANGHIWCARSSSLPTNQKYLFSPPGSLNTSGTPRPVQEGNRMVNPDPRTHILRAQSQPTHLPSELSTRSFEAHDSGIDKRSVGRDRVAVEENIAKPAWITGDDPVPLVRGEDASSRSSSYSDSSGEFSSNYSPRDPSRSPEQMSFAKKQDVAVTKVGPVTKQGSLSRPPPIALINISPEALSTHELLNGLGPDDASSRRLNRESDSEDEAQRRQEELDTDVDSVEGIHERPQEPVIEVVSPNPVQIAIVPKGKKATDSVESINERAGVVENRPSETEGNGEPSYRAEMQESTALPAEQDHTLLINLTQSPVQVDEVQHPKSDECGSIQTVVFPWTKGDLLGAGSFGTVYEAVDSNGSFFAVKEVSLVDTDKNSQQCVTQLEQEIELLSRFKHDNIVQYLGTQRADGKLYIFLELVSKGSLSSLCKKFRLTHSHIIAYTRQILKGLKYLHDQNIVHRDIKCANILVDVKGTCKLADFGLAKQISALDQLKSCKGSAYWMAPEVIDPKKTYWLPADIWSLGCSVLEMFTGSPPFGDQEWYRVLWKVGHGEAPPIPDDLSEDAKDFIRLCLEVNPSKRPTATVLLQHRFLSASMTPTNSGHINPQLVVSNLQTITEERTGDFTTKSTETYRSSPSDSPLSNGHS